MTYDEIKNLLEDVRKKKAQLVVIEAYMEEERDKMKGLSSLKYDNVSVVHSQMNGTEERMVKCLDRYKKWEERHDKLFEEMCAEEDLLCIMMQILSPTEYEILLNLYMKGLSIKKTAKLMHFEYDSIRQACYRAIKKMVKI